MDDAYKREEDRKWRERVDERLAALTAGENVQDDRIDDMETRAIDLDRILRGDPDKDSEGVIEHVHDLQKGLNVLRALMAPDAIGQGGILNRLKALEKKEGREERKTEYRWKFWMAVIGFISATTVAVITNFDRIKGTFEHAPVVKVATKPGHHKSRSHAKRQEDQSGTSEEKLPEVQDDHAGDAR